MENEKNQVKKHSIDRTELDYDGDMALYNDVSYTGLTYTLYYNNGKLKSLYPYEGGFANGICRDWYENGHIEREITMRRGQTNGYEKCWHSNGMLKSISNCILGRIIDYKEWDENCKLVEFRSYEEFFSHDELYNCKKNLDCTCDDKYKNVVNEENLNIVEGKATCNGKVFSGVSYKFEIVITEETYESKLLRLISYKDGYENGNILEGGNLE